MKLTNRQLRQIIKEELESVMGEGHDAPEYKSYVDDIIREYPEFADKASGPAKGPVMSWLQQFLRQMVNDDGRAAKQWTYSMMSGSRSLLQAVAEAAAAAPGHADEIISGAAQDIHGEW